MNKKFNLFGIVAVLALIFIIAGCGEQQKSPVEVNELNKTDGMSVQCVDPEPPQPPSECEPMTYDLLAGKTILVGDVTVWNDETNLYVQYNTSGDWYLTEVHLYVLTEEPTERLNPGHAPYKGENLNNVTTYTLTVPFAADWDCDMTLYLQAHAAVVKIVDGEVVQSETGYGGDIYPKAKPWYGNIVYTICCENGGGGGDCQEETAWGGDSAGEGNAWWFYFDTQGSATQTIYAGQKETDGTVTWDGTNLVIDLGSWSLQDVSESVKIQGYSVIPTTRPSAGLFTLYKGTALTVAGDGSRYYAIHLDVELCP